MSTKRHSLYNVIGPVISVLIVVATVPLYLELIGEARFGVMAIIWLLTTYFGFFDMGMGRVATYRLARLDPGDMESMRTTFWTGLAINIVFGLIGAALLLLLAGPIFTHLINLSPDLEAELFAVLPLIALGIPGLTTENFLSGAMAGRRQFLALNIRFTMSAAFVQIIPLIAVWQIAPTLEIAVPAIIAARWLGAILSLVIAMNVLGITWKIRWGGRKMAFSMLNMGKWLALADGLRVQIAGLDRIFIGIILNATSVARYTVPYQLVMRGGVFAAALPNALFPRLSSSDAEEKQELALRGLKANAALMLVLCTIGMVAMHPFLSWWIDAEFAGYSAIVGQIIAISLWFGAVAHIPLTLIQADGRMREIAGLTAIQFIPFLLLGVPAMMAWGIAGMAMARAVTSLIDLLLLSWRAQLLAKSVMIVLPSMAFLSSILIAIQLNEFWSLEGIVTAVAIISVSIIGAMIVSPDLRAIAVSYLPFAPTKSKKG